MKLNSNAGHNRQKRNEIWQGIVRKARNDGDHSLDELVEDSNYRRIRYTWISAAAAILIVLGVLYILRLSPDRYIKEQELATIFGDTASYSKLVLSTGDTIALDNPENIAASISYLQDENNVIDFRKLESKGFENRTQLVETGRGKQTYFILSDGTKVWLNAASRIEFPASFEADERLVSISGEVYFEVAHHQQKPFIVMSEDHQIRVLGTHFNVKQYKNDTERNVTLLEGAVEISVHEDTAEKFRLRPAQQFVQSLEKHPYIQQISDPETAIAWKEDAFYFEDADALEIVKELERWYPVKIQLKQYIKDKKISGRIRRSDSLREVADMLQFFGIQILVEKD